MSKHLSLTLVLVLVLILIVTGCTSSTTATKTVIHTTTETIAQTTEEVSSLDLELRVVTIGFGLEILLIPRSDDGFLVETDGSIDAKLWPQYSLGGKADISNPINEWNDIQLSDEDYIQFVGARIELNYDEYKSLAGVYCFLDVTLTTPDGKILTAELQDIYISEAYDG